MAVVADTSVLITAERRGQGLELLNQIAPGEASAVAAISISELLIGAHRSDTPARRRIREEFVDVVVRTLQILPFGLAEARIHAGLLMELRATGQVIGPNDLLIAATALANGYAVLTENVREFERVPGLSVRRPAW
jgi:tRNA(fMet)-specific endonuclease VapC